MPYLEINSCTECPFAEYGNSNDLPSEFLIRCGHQEKKYEDPNYRMIRIGSRGIYFNCPLPQEIVREDEDY